MRHQKFSRDEREQLAQSITDTEADHPQGFFARLQGQLQPEVLPSVTVEWSHLTVQTEATNSAASLPSISNVIIKTLKAVTCQRAKREQLTILNNLSGTLQPGRLTLLLGPPSCGKTTFLRALAGRLPPKSFSGSVTYNGHSFKDFCAPRTAAFVPQSDTHIPNYTALETTSFANDLQHGPHDSTYAVASCMAGADGKPATGRQRASQQGSVPRVSSASKPDDTPPTGSASPAVSTDKLQPGTSVQDLSAGALQELVAEMLDGPGKAHTIMEMFGLSRAKDTWVGNATVPGLSGGERKRLGTVELLQGGHQVLLLDEISTGLDAATLFTIIKWLRAMTHKLSQTVLISLLQPPPETYRLFDDVMLMSEGVVVYHGPIDSAVAHMCSFGFQLPPRKDVPSFLQELTTVRGQLLYGTSELRARTGVPEDTDPHDEVAVAQLDKLISLDTMRSEQRAEDVNSGSNGHAAGQAADAQGGKGNPRGGVGEGALIPKSEQHAWGALPMLRRVLARQAVLFRRDPTLTRARLIQSTVIGLLIGGLWFQLEASYQDSRTVLSAFFFFILFITLSGTPQLNVMLQNRATFFKQRGANMYTAAAYAWSAALVQVPLACVESMVFIIIAYFMIGLTTDGAGYFFICWLVLITASLSLTACFRFLACAILSPAAAQAASGFTLLVVIVGSGYIIVRSAIPKWMIWLYWLSPFSWSVRALAVNEMTSPKWQGVTALQSGAEAGTAEAGTSLGDSALVSFDFYTQRYWIWAGIAYNLVSFAVVTQVSALALHYLKPGKPVPVVKSKEQVAEGLRAARQARQEAQEKLQGDANGQATADAHNDGTGASAQRASHSGLDVASQLGFTPISLVWQDLSYYVPAPKNLAGAAAKGVVQKGDTEDEELVGKKQLLHGITGYAQPGVLTALMGATGAGKTTLMDVLAGRKTQGLVRGHILVNGHEKVQDTWARVVGYVEQADVHSAGLTVEESLRFSAALRLTSDVAARTRAAYVLEVLVVTELLDIRGNLVGSPGVSGLSVEQRRRLSIGVELVSNPSVVFMDEPTSGLDARSAATVMAAVRNVAGNGRTVMVTIHQPSIEIFESFDRLVLLGTGGHSIYIGDLGPQSCKLVDYLQAVKGVEPIEEGYNPATWMLEVTGSGYKNRGGEAGGPTNFAQVYRNSSLCRHNTETADDIAAKAAAKTEPLQLASRYAATGWQQVVQVTRKLFLVYWRTPSYSVGRLLTPIVSAILYGLVWFQEGTVTGTATIADVSNILGAIYSSLSQLGIANMIAGIPVFHAERSVMYKEKAAGMYAVFPYAVATGIVELPYLLLQALIFTPVFYFLAGFRAEAEPFFLFVIIFAESLTLYTFLGQLLVYLVATAPVASLMGSLTHTFWTVLNGYLIPRPLMAKGWWWANYLCGTTYVIYAVGAGQLGDQTETTMLPPGGGAGDYPGCSPDALDQCPSLSQWLEDYFGYKYAFRWWCVLILLGFITFFRVAAMLTLKFVSHDSR